MAGTSLLERLVSIYYDDPIRYPGLRAVTLAQWMLESGRGTSGLATAHYNLAGMKWRSEMAPYATKVLYLAHDGPDYYCKFATLENFIAGYWAFLNRSPYSGWEEHTDDPEDFIGFIGKTYSGSDTYAAKVLALLPEAEALLRAAAAAPADDAPAPAAADGALDLGTLVIDPGHGGTQPLPGSSPNNAISVSGVKEKKLTLDFALLLKSALERQAHGAGETLRVVLTRSSDVNVAGRDRAQRAFTTGARAFLSLHFNGNANPTPSGVETYLRAQENGNINYAEDLAFAQAVQAGLLSGLRSVAPGTKDRGVKPDTQTQHSGGLAVLSDINLGNTTSGRRCVAALAEIEFITNPAVDARLVSGPDALENRAAVMESLATALRRYLHP